MKTPQNILKMSLVVIAVLVTLGAGYTHWRLIHSAQNRLADLQEQATTLQQAIDQSKAGEHLVSLQNELVHFDQTLPAQGEVASVLENLSRELQTQGVSNRSMVTGQPITGPRVQRIPLSLRFGGSFASVFKLLGHVKGLKRLVRVKQLVIRRDFDKSADALAVSLTLQSFGRAQEAH